MFFFFQKATGIDASENAAGFVNLFLIALATFSTAYNVVLYIIFNPNFKQAIKSVLQCPRCPKRRKQPVNNDQIRHTAPPACSATANVLPKLKGGVMKIYTVTSNSDKSQSQLTGSDNSKPSPYRGVLEPRRSLNWHSN